jgi:hypothetical protein
MEPEDSLPCLQQPAKGSYPERDASHPSSPRHILILYSHLRLVSLILFLWGFPTKILRAFLIYPMRATWQYVTGLWEQSYRYQSDVGFQ